MCIHVDRAMAEWIPFGGKYICFVNDDDAIEYKNCLETFSNGKQCRDVVCVKVNIDDCILILDELSRHSVRSVRVVGLKESGDTVVRSDPYALTVGPFEMVEPTMLYDRRDNGVDKGGVKGVDIFGIAVEDGSLWRCTEEDVFLACSRALSTPTDTETETISASELLRFMGWSPASCMD